MDKFWPKSGQNAVSDGPTSNACSHGGQTTGGELKMRDSTNSPVRAVLPLLGLLSLPNRAPGQIHQCAPSDDARIRAVSIIGTEGSPPKSTIVDTLWVPSEGRLSDRIFVRVVIEDPTARPGDSVYVAATLELMLQSGFSKKGASAPKLIAFPTRSLRDTVFVFQRSDTVTIGPFSTNALVPWPGIAVQTTANALPVGARAAAWVLRVGKNSRPTCVEALQNNIGRSPLARITLAH